MFTWNDDYWRVYNIYIKKEDKKKEEENVMFILLSFLRNFKVKFQYLRYSLYKILSFVINFLFFLKVHFESCYVK